MQMNLFWSMVEEKAIDSSENNEIYLFVVVVVGQNRPFKKHDVVDAFVEEFSEMNKLCFSNIYKNDSVLC